jgi:hypothetical protein
MPVAGSKIYCSAMQNATNLAMELRHNDEAVGRVYGGAVDIHDDEEVQHSHARFWHGIRGLRSRIALRRTLLPSPGGNVVALVVR